MIIQTLRTAKQRETVTCDKCGGLKVHPDLPNAKCSRCAGTGLIPYRIRGGQVMTDTHRYLAIPGANVPIDRPQIIARMEASGALVPTCQACVEFYETPDPRDTFAPRHQASARCQSGRRSHCSCDTCF